MPFSKCVFSREGRTCHYEFTSDGHTLCVPHRPCVSPEFVFAPEDCSVCEENVKFLRAVGHVDRLTQQFVALKSSWDAVRRSAKRKGLVPSWRDSTLREFVLGRHGRRPPSSVASSTSRSSPCPSLPGEPVAGPSSAAQVAPPSPSPPPPAASAPLPSLAGEGVSPQLQDFVRGLVDELGASLRQSLPTASAPAASPVPPPRAASPAPPRAPSPAPSTPYEDDLSPGSDGAAAEAEDVHDQLPDSWIPVPQGWEVHHDGSAHILLRPDPVSAGSLARVTGQRLRWGVSAHSPVPGWHFRSEAHPLHSTTALPCPSWDDVHNALSGLSLLAGFSPPVVETDGDENPRRSVGFPWTEGHADHFLRAVREWWLQSAPRGQSAQPPRPAARLRFPAVPLGSSLDARVGAFLLSRPSRSFPPPLATPSADSLRAGEKDRQLALESFSGLATLLSLESLLQQFSQSHDLASSVSAPVLCAQLLPVLRSALWQLAPASAADLSRAMSSHLACWRQAVAPLPPVAQSALLASDPFLPGFGSAQSVSDALARAPQVAVVYRGQSSARPSAARGRSSSATRRQPPSRPPTAPRPQRQDVRYQPYPPRPSRSAAAPREPRGLQARDTSTSSRRREGRPFRASSSVFRGTRR